MKLSEQHRQKMIDQLRLACPPLYGPQPEALLFIVEAVLAEVSETAVESNVDDVELFKAFSRATKSASIQDGIAKLLETYTIARK